MRVKINRELKIKVLKALKQGYFETKEIKELSDIDDSYDLPPLTNEELDFLKSLNDEKENRIKIKKER